MYTFRIQDDLKAYDEFICNNGGQYIQCSRWQKVKTTWNCRYYGGFDERELRCLPHLLWKEASPLQVKYGTPRAVWYAITAIPYF